MCYDGLTELAFVTEETYSYRQYIDLSAQFIGQLKILQAGCILGGSHDDRILPQAFKLCGDVDYVLFVETVMVGLILQGYMMSLAFDFSLHENR